MWEQADATATPQRQVLRRTVRHTRPRQDLHPEIPARSAAHVSPGAHVDVVPGGLGLFSDRARQATSQSSLHLEQALEVIRALPEPLSFMLMWMKPIALSPCSSAPAHSEIQLGEDLPWRLGPGGWRASQRSTLGCVWLPVLSRMTWTTLPAATAPSIAFQEAQELLVPVALQAAAEHGAFERDVDLYTRAPWSLRRVLVGRGGGAPGPLYAEIRVGSTRNRDPNSRARTRPY